MLAHHVISIVAYGVALTDGRCHFFGCAAGLSEVSTIFLQGVLFSKHPHAKEWWPEWFTIFNGVSLWACYIPFRLVLFPAITALYVADAARTRRTPSAGNNEPPSAGNNATPPRKPEAAIGEADARRPREALEIRALSAGLTALVMALALDLELHGRARLVEEVRLEEAAMALATAWAGVLTVVAGYYAHPGWRALQPFEGGGGFVTVQALGWMLYACSLFAIVVMAANAPAAPRGAAFAVGCLELRVRVAEPVGAALRRRAPEARGRAAAPQRAPRDADGPGAPPGAQRRRPVRRGRRRALASRTAEPSRALLAALEASAPSLIASGAGCLGIGALVTHGVHGPLAVAATALDALRRREPPLLLQALVDALRRRLRRAAGRGPGRGGARRRLPVGPGRRRRGGERRPRGALDHFEADKPASRWRRRRRARRRSGSRPCYFSRAPSSASPWASTRRYAGAKAPHAMATLATAPRRWPTSAARARRGYGVFMVGVGGPKFVITQACGWMLYSCPCSRRSSLCLNDAAPRPLMVALAPLAVISSGIIVASVPSSRRRRRRSRGDGRRRRDAERCRRCGESCDAAKLFADGDADGAPARAAAARAACEELWRLRQAAASAPARALLDAAVAALGADAASSLGLDIDPREEPADDDDDPDPGDLRLGDDLALDGGLARRRRRRRAAEFLGVLAAPLASALGVGLLATAESLEGQLSPALAACACAATFAAAPLQFRLERGDRAGGRFARCGSRAPRRRRRRALGWKFACFLHDRGAPVLRCGICGDVDDAQGPNEFVLAPCAARGADGAADAVLEGAGLPSSPARGAAGRDVGACARCGRGLAPGLRHPAGPRELGARAAGRVARTCGASAAGAGRRAAFAAWLAVQCSLVHLFASPAFSVMVSRIWTGPRDHVRFYLRLYAYYVGAGAAVVAHFSPLAGLLAQVDCAAPSAFRRCAAALLGLASWLNLAGYAAVSSASLFLFAKANYHLLTVADTA
ncbi:histone demethylase [Aureococcus anophagefferens]|nr:histone demethylase [Aureococcus anophagefferens]